MSGARALLLLLALSAAGCSITVEREGDAAFIENHHAIGRWRPGVTTPVEVARALGPPDEILRQDAELWYRYRFRDIRRAKLLLNAYGLNVFQYEDKDEVLTSLVVVFGPDDKLCYCGVNAGPMVRKLVFVDY